MSDSSDQLQSNFSPLSDEHIVYRVLTGKTWVDKIDQSLSVQAFLRRPSDIDGVSVDTVQLTREQISLSCIGVVSLKVGDIRRLGLDVIPDSPTHAYIVGLPYPLEDRLHAESLAEKLVEICKLEWYDRAWYVRKK